MSLARDMFWTSLHRDDVNHRRLPALLRGRQHRGRRRVTACLTALSMIAGVVPALVLFAATAPAAAAPAPSAVTDVSANSLTSGTLFGGRPEALAVNPVNRQIVLAAAEFGGLWRSNDGGAHWAHVDGLPLTAMDDVQFAASDPSLVVATGEYDGASSTVNAEVYVSNDGGNVWTRANTTSCAGNPRSAHKIAIGTGTPGSLTIVVATDCGLVRSDNSGVTWSNVSPNGVNNQFWDVKIRGTGPNFTIDSCGGSGFFRTTDGGTNWAQNAGALAGGSVPCRVATAPNNASVVLLASWAQASSPVNGLCMGQLLESDNGGTSFTNLNATQDGNCRAASVITAPGFNAAPANNFEVFFATDTNWIHEQCDTNNLTNNPPTTACPVGDGNNGGSFSDYDSSVKAVHNGPDSTDLAFGADGCPFLTAGDGGVFATTQGCNTSPAFTQSNVGLHALQATATGGTSYTGHTDLYMPTQDNGIFNSPDGGTNWADRGPDVYGVLADQDGPSSQVLYKTCCQNSGGTVVSSVSQDNETLTSASGFTLPSTGVIPLSAPFLNVTGAQFGHQSYAMITCTGYTQFATGTCTGTAKVFVTTNNGSNWAQMGPDLPANSNPLQLLASGPSASPTFYLLNQVNGNAPTVSRLSGPLNATATFTALTNGLTSPGRIGVDPSNPLLLYAEDDGGTPVMRRSTNGGATWTADNTLTTMIRNTNAFALPGFVTAIGFDGATDTILVGTASNGIFASTNGGNSWAQLRGSVAVQSATGFFFDEKTGKAYSASKGRGMWEIDLPHADLAVTKTHSPDPVIAGQQLTWHISVTNNGPAAAPDVTVTDTLPAHDTYLTNNLNPPAGCTAAGQTVTCTLGDLDNGQTVNFDIVTLVDPDTVSTAGGPTSITNVVTVASAAVIDSDTSNNTAQDTAVVNDSADLSVAKLCKPDTTIYAGTPINCTVFVDNQGPSYARQVVIDDTTLSNGAFTISNVAVSPGPTSCTTNNVTGGQEITCNVGDLAAASTTETGRVTLTYTITATEGQNINNKATVRSDTPDPDTSNNTTTVNLTVSSLADLALTKNGPGSVVAGTPITWTLSATNNGPSTANNVAITDTVPAGVTITGVTMPGASCTSGKAGDPTQPTVCTLGSLGPGATSSTMTINATVNPSTTGILQNDARVSANEFDNNSSNDLAHTETTVQTRADLAIVLTSDALVYKPSTTIHYQITVSNNGPSDAQNVVITQALPTVKQGKYISNSLGCPPPSGTTLTCSYTTVPALVTIPAGGTITFRVDFFITGNKGTITSSASVTTATTDPVTSNNTSTRSVTVR
jgi:uncharacterized repeat protein (TIGR01451 family)